MLKLSSKHSITVSILTSYLCLAVLTAVALTAHDYTGIWFGVPQIAPQLPIVIFTYLELPIAYAAVFLLLRLLRHIARREVFVMPNVKILRALSWCCFAETLLFLAEGVVLFGGKDFVAKELFLGVLLFAAFACGFVGMILRVVKNALHEGVALKEENDGTI